jgi:glucose-6-phosphate 1-epimerase
MLSIQYLNQQFALGDLLKFAEHPSGLMMGLIKTPLCEARFFLQGAHVAHFHPTHTQRPILFMSEAAVYEPGRPIRGGIPICFPWFSSHPTQPALPAHGWARTSAWQVTSTRFSNNQLVITLMLEHDDWQLTYQLTFGSTLRASFAAKNVGPNPRSFEIALHTYFDIGAIQETEITGDLSVLPYLDQLTSEIRPPLAGPIKFEAETDRIYHGSAPEIRVQDNRFCRVIHIHAKNSKLHDRLESLDREIHSHGRLW